MDVQWHAVRFNVGCVSLIHVLSEVLLRGSSRESLWLQNSCSVPPTHTHTRLEEWLNRFRTLTYSRFKKHWIAGNFGALEVSPDAVRYFHLTSTAPELHLSVITASELLSWIFFFFNRNIRTLFLTSFLYFCYFMCP